MIVDTDDDRFDGRMALPLVNDRAAKFADVTASDYYFFFSQKLDFFFFLSRLLHFLFRSFGPSRNFFFLQNYYSVPLV